MKAVGQPIRKKDAMALVTGKPVFMDDLAPKDMNSLIFKDEYSAVSSCCQKSSYEGLEEILSAIEKAKVRLNANVNTDLALELMLLTMKEN